MSKPEREKRKYTKREKPVDPVIIAAAAGTSNFETPGWVKEARKVQDEPPEKDPLSGDKTESYMKWFKENHSKEDFESKYGSRKCPEIQ